MNSDLIIHNLCRATEYSLHAKQIWENCWKAAVHADANYALAGRYPPPKNLRINMRRKILIFPFVIILVQKP